MLKTRLIHIILLVLINSLLACRKDDVTSDDSESYDVILVAGQSNTHYGWGYDSLLDHPDARIMQLGRFDEQNYKIVQATEPLDNHTRKKNRIGFALTFAKLYADMFLEDNRNILIIPCGRAGSGFKNNQWNPDDIYYKDAVERTRFVFNYFKKSKLVAILWHQGEDDVSNPEYQSELDHFISTLRSELGATKVPLILGGMVPYWVEQAENRVVTQQIIKNTPQRMDLVGYADPSYPFPIVKEIDSIDAIHFDASGMRELGLRYFTSYIELRE